MDFYLNKKQNLNYIFCKSSLYHAGNEELFEWNLPDLHELIDSQYLSIAIFLWASHPLNDLNSKIASDAQSDEHQK